MYESAPPRNLIETLFLNPELCASERKLAPMSGIHRPGTPADSVWYIRRGQVRLHQPGPEGSGRLLEILGPGDWFGVEALAASGAWHTAAVAVGETDLLEAPARRVLGVASRQPEIARELLREMAAKLLAAREDAACLIFDDCNTRLLNALVRFSRSPAASRNGDGVVLHMTHHQLAQAVGVARETVSLALTHLRRRKLLRTGRNRLLFDPRVLGRLVEGGRKDDHAPVYDKVA